MHIPNKVKLLMWKIFKNILPSKFILDQRHINTHPWCVCCGKEAETLDHTFIRCKRSKGLWSLIVSTVLRSVSIYITIQGVRVEMASSLSRGEFKLFCMGYWWFGWIGIWLIWEIWLGRWWSGWSRLKSTFMNSNMQIVCLARWGAKWVACSSMDRWFLPSWSGFKLNVDASCVSPSSIGLGAMVRDHWGVAMVYVFLFIEYCCGCSCY